jgi:hypothetical protein
MTGTDENLVTVANFQARWEAESAAGLLLGDDIPYLIQSREGAGLGPGPGGSSLLVRPEDAERARQILDDAGAVSGDQA